MVHSEKQMKMYLTPHPYSVGYSPASYQTFRDTIKFSSEIGFKAILLGKKVKIPINPAIYYLKMVMYSKKADVILATYPYICRPTRDNPIRSWESKFIKKINRNNFSILYIIDLPIEQSISDGGRVERRAFKIEEQILKSFDVLLIFNKNMKINLQQKYGIEDRKFIEFEILDYGIEDKSSPSKKLEKPYRIVYTPGSVSEVECPWIKDLIRSDNIQYEFFGNNGEWIKSLNRKDIKYKGFFPQDDLSKYISLHSHFGLVFYRQSFNDYVELTSTSKFSSYVISGIPILVPSRYAYISELVKKYNVGFSFDSIHDIPLIIGGLNGSQYIDIRNNCIKLGNKIKKGYFFKKAVEKALIRRN